MQPAPAPGYRFAHPGYNTSWDEPGDQRFKMDRHVEQRREIGEQQNRNEPGRQDENRTLVQVDDRQEKQQPEIKVRSDLPSPMQPRHGFDGLEDVFLAAAVDRIGREQQEGEPD